MAGQHPAVHGNSGPGDALHERHVAVFVEVGVVVRLFLHHAEYAGRRFIAGLSGRNRRPLHQPASAVVDADALCIEPDHCQQRNPAALERHHIAAILARREPTVVVVRIVLPVLLVWAAVGTVGVAIGTVGAATELRAKRLAVGRPYDEGNGSDGQSGAAWPQNNPEGHAVHSRGQRLLYRPGDAKASILHTYAGRTGIAISRTKELRVIVPRAAAQDVEIAARRLYGRAVGGRAGVAVLVAVLDPLPHIAVHVVETEGVGLEGADLEGLLAVDAHLGASSVDEIAVVVGLIGIDGRARRECW